MDYENSKNPFRERREQIAKRRSYSTVDVQETEDILRVSARVSTYGIKKIDSLHIACAVEAQADYFLTTDDRVLNKAGLVQDVQITDPIGFIKEVSE